VVLAAGLRAGALASSEEPVIVPAAAAAAGVGLAGFSLIKPAGGLWILPGAARRQRFPV